jgi:zinc protease
VTGGRAMSKTIILSLIAAVALAQAPAKAPEKAAARTALAPPASSPAQLKYPPLKPVTIPDVEMFTLPNGMRVYLLENHELPVVSGTALVRTGNLFDPPGKVGLATITGSQIRAGGTTSKTGDEIDEQLENIAASVESSIGETSGQVSFSALKENTDEVMAVFYDVLTSPAFREDKLSLAKQQMASAILRRNDDADSIAGREYASIVYGRDNPYGWRIELADIANIRRDDVVAFYKRYFFPRNIMLAIYGDFSAPAMRAKLETLFGGWNYEQPPVPAFPPLSAKAAPGIYLAAKDDVNQTFFSLGHIGGVLKDRDTAALEIMADILGGGFSSRLFKRVRTQLGYAYGIGASWGVDYDHPGLFQISGSTKSASTVDTLRVVREEIERIRTTPVSDEELKIAKDTVLNGFVFAFDTPAKTLSRILRYEYYGYPRDFIFDYQKAIAAVTKEDVLRVAREHLKPENITIVAVGNPQDFGTPLTALGLPVHKIDLTIPKPPEVK